MRDRPPSRYYNYSKPASAIPVLKAMAERGFAGASKEVRDEIFTLCFELAAVVRQGEAYGMNVGAGASAN